MRKLSIVFSLSCFSFLANAQKIGYFNSAEVLKDHPSIKKADSNVNAYIEVLKTGYSYLQDEYKEKSEKLKDSSSLNEVKKTMLKQDIVALEGKLNNYQNDATQKLTSRRNELYLPINKKLTNIVEVMAKENKYDAIFDISTTSIFYVNKFNDLTNDIKKKFK